MNRARPEGNFNDSLREGLYGLDPVRVENGVGPGTPDIEYLGGWIESKSIPELPARAATVVALAHYRPAQRAWHVRRRMAGGRVHVALRVESTREVLLFDALAAAQHLGVDWNTEALRHSACLWLKCWNVQEFQDWLAQTGVYDDLKRRDAAFRRS